MPRRSALLFLIAAIMATNAFCASGNLVVYDDTDENGFLSPFAICTGVVIAGETAVVHSGSAAIAVSKGSDNNGVGWVPPTTYSASSDYDGISFWINAGNDQTTVTSLAVFDGQGNPHFLHLEDMHGGPLPANTWIGFQIPFSSEFFATAGSTPPATVNTVCLVNHSLGNSTAYFYVDDVMLTGADIFKDGFGG